MPKKDDEFKSDSLRAIITVEILDLAVKNRLKLKAKDVATMFEEFLQEEGEVLSVKVEYME